MGIGSLDQSSPRLVADGSSPQLLICLLDPDGRVVRTNDMLRRWGIVNARPIAGQHLHDALHADCKVDDCYLRHFCDWGTAELAGGRRVECDAFDPVLKRFFTIRGQPTQLRLERRREQRDQPDVLAMVTFEDITDARIADERILRLNRELGEQVVRELERRQQEESLRLRMQTLVECTANLVAMTDAEGCLTYLNPAGRTMLGIPAWEDVSALAAVDLHAEAVRPAMATEAVPTAMSRGTWTGRSVLRRRDGSHIETSQVIISHKTTDGRHDGLSIVAHDMAPWLEGEQTLRESHEELARLSEQLISIQETERRRIAADIHDGIGQSLSLLKLQVSTATAQLEMGAAAEAMATLKSLIPKVQYAMDEVRRVATDLHPSTLDDLGILPTLAWFFRELESVYHGIEVVKVFDVREADVHPSRRIVIYRIIQEAVSNIVKHAMPERISVTLRQYEDRLMLTIEDDGRGFDPGTVVGIDCSGRGFGLTSMKERARLSGGIYRLRSAIGKGTRIEVEWPDLATG